jgi:hypothetical protein
MIMTDRSPADFRALCTELVDAIASGIATKRMYRSALVIRARAILAEPQPPAGEVAELVAWMRRFARVDWIADATANKLTRAADLMERLAATGKPGLQVEPTDEELLGIDDLRDAWNAQADSANSWDELGIDEIVWWAQQQALARWGRPAPQPISVSERLPDAGDCAPWPDEPDADVWCWVGSDVDGGWEWEQRSAGCLQAFPDDYTHWLPATALPLPSGEVK